ncbi:unnamed protein product [Rotaria socialis]
MHTTTFSDEDYRVQYLGTNPSLRLPIWYMILFSFLGHSLLFYCLPTSITPFIKSYIISTVHACVSVLAVSIFYGRGLIDFTQVNKILGGGMAGTPDETMTYSICYSSGYFIYDLLIMLWFKSVRTPSAIAHHIIILVAGLADQFTTKIAIVSLCPKIFSYTFTNTIVWHFNMTIVQGVTMSYLKKN